MLARLLVAIALLGACSGKSDSPGAANTEALSFPFVSDTIAHQLGDANVIIAIDLGKFGLEKFSSMVPPMLGCVREVLGKVGVAVIGSSESGTQGFVTGLPEEATKKCAGSLAPLLGVTTADVAGAWQLTAGGDKFQVTWKDGVAGVKDVAHPVKPGAPNARIRGLVAQVPKDAWGWIVSGGFPKYKITQSVAYLTSAPKVWKLVVTADSSEPGVAKDWLSGIVTGFKQGAAQKGVTVEDSWFKLTENGTAARLEGEIPDNLFSTPVEADE
ncbi:MAG: hypothetical protein JNL83_02900 [Myxococcales bacterium]|nr:hypothetical protein [Myxococcales bacterium]